MYFIATGRAPFRAKSAFAVINKITREVPKPARSINIDVPEVLNRIIERLLEKEPRDRIESAEKLEGLLTQVLAHLQEPTQHVLPDVRATTVERRRVRHRIGWGLTIAGILLAGCLAWAGLFGSQPLNSNQEPGHGFQSGEGSNEHIELHESENTDGEGNRKHN